MVTTEVRKGQTLRRIEKRSNLSRQELLEKYIEPELPVVVTDATHDWSAMGKLTPDFFKAEYGHLTKEIKGKTYTLTQYINMMMESTPENPAPYPFNLNIRNHCPELLDDLKPEIIYGKSDRINHPLMPRFMLHGTDIYEFFFGGNGASFPFLHVDALYLHTQITQLYGAKEFILFPPEQAAYMYPRPDNEKISQVDVFNPDYDKFPLFQNVEPLRIVVEEGETILFPTKWWHTTRIHEPCISLGRVQLNAGNWDDFTSDNYKSWQQYRPGIAKPALLYAKTLGKLMDIQEKFNG